MRTGAHCPGSGSGGLLSAAVTTGISILKGGWHLNQVCGHSTNLFQLLGSLPERWLWHLCGVRGSQWMLVEDPPGRYGHLWRMQTAGLRWGSRAASASLGICFQSQFQSCDCGVWGERGPETRVKSPQVTA